MDEIENEFWSSQPIMVVSVYACVYGVRNLSGPIFNPAPIRVEYLPVLRKFLVHDGRHRIEWYKENSIERILASVYCPQEEAEI